MTFKPPVKVFLSYSHEDTGWCGRFYQHLSGLRRDGKISVWFDALNDPGRPWKAQIDKQLSEAEVFLFLLSPGFGDSDNCDYEFDTAQRRMEQGNDVEILLIRLREWDMSEKYRRLHWTCNDSPILSQRNRDKALKEIVCKIREFIDRRWP